MGKFKVGDAEFNLTIAVGPAAGNTPVQEVTSSGSITAMFDLTSGSNLQFVCRGDAPEAEYIDELATDVWLLGDIKLRYRAWAVWQQWYPNGQDNVSVMGVSYKKLLNRRHVMLPPPVDPENPPKLEFNDADLGDVIWGMWEHTQSLPGGNLGVTSGARTTGIVRTRTYENGENLGQQADEEYDEGIWWDIDHDLVFTAGALDANPFVPTPLHLGANVREMQRASGGEFANAVYGDASQETIPVWAVDPNVTTDPRGRWERAVGWPTVVLQQTLDDRVNAALAESLNPGTHWNLTMEPARWVGDSRIMPGDHAVLVVPRSLAAPVGQPTPTVAVLITSVQVTFDDKGSLEVTAVAEERPNIPVPS